MRPAASLRAAFFLYGQGLHFPGVAAVEQVVHAFVFAVGHLLVHLLLVELGVADLLDVADDAEGDGQAGRRTHVGQHHVDASVLGGLVVDHDIVQRDAVLADGNHFELAAVEAQTFLLVLAEEHGLAVLEHDGAVVADGAVGDGGVRLVVEDDAVLQHLGNRAAVVLGGAGHALGGKLRHTVEGAGEEGALGTHHELTGIEGVVDGAVGRGLCNLAELGGGAVLTLGETVDLVVEDGDVEVLVAAHGVDEVVAADGHRVAVAHVYPHAEGGVGEFDAGGDGAGATVDAVEAVGVDIVGDTARAADTGDHADVLFLVARLGEGGQQGGEDGVVATTGAPLHHLVALEISLGVFFIRFGNKMLFHINNLLIC